MRPDPIPRVLTVRARLALTVLLTGLATAAGVLLAVAQAFERVDRETTWARANGFLQRVVQQHEDLLARQRMDPEGFDRFLRSLLLFDPSSQLYLLAGDGTVLARTGVAPLSAGFRVRMAPVRLAAGHTGTAATGPAGLRLAAYVMGDDPEHMAHNAVVAAHGLQDTVILPSAGPAGFLYVVCRPPGLPPSRLQALATHLGGPALLPVLAVIVLTTLLAAWIIGAVTRPLARLSQQVDQLAQAGFDASPAALVAAPPGAPGDEIARLRTGFAQLLVRLHAQWDRLRQLDAQRRESVSNLSHDLRSPLTAAVAGLETLLQRWQAEADGGPDGSTPPGRDADRRLVDVALRNTHGAARLVRALGDLAVLDEAEFRLRPMRLDLVEMLDDIGARFADRARALGLDLVVDLGSDDPLPAEIDVELFERALANLLDNAMRHTPAGGRITMAAAQADGRLQVVVTDTGSGMSHDDLARIFERRHQGASQPAAARNVGGHGLGLAIVKRIIALHQGQVTVRSAPGAGTTVTLHWPARLDAPGAATPARTGAAAG